MTEASPPRLPVDRAVARAAFQRAAAGEREAFGDFFLARLLGFEISHRDDACEVAFEAQDYLFNPQGTLHGGVIATALDIAMGHRLQRVAGAGTTPFGLRSADPSPDPSPWTAEGKSFSASQVGPARTPPRRRAMSTYSHDR